ncbi:hypothetical protein TPHA_0E01310 [Tetrapisispora phaffii CBS 4417]|uniref:Glycosylphosphatidylinositol anchor biosynthesis protein 11 n=1 Tax=Tetrapisispora phaffii (strain ATCC 24235 / CBS 4417 / NBRC 1672 / NRRL Y-8282 / UCD 70-5) TaxID=1071381 RepID=G8BTJ8_TETPH|nr:hypothetical protein TPHA_0E01310 [Tetrapisispora phaffii CBS 4417]CCE63226.1 hypothetical protein TPHA_0E01310 [Tetrapisispora phaffii CBS 4417]
MPVKKRTNAIKKKSVTFSDDTTVTQNEHNKKDKDSEHPPVSVKKTIFTIPIHLLGLLYCYIFVSESFDTLKLLCGLIPTQILYVILQFNRNTVYGNKRLKVNVLLIFIAVFAALGVSLPIMLGIILFGAPLIDKSKETLLLALHASFLAYPAIYSVFNCNFKVGTWKKYFIFIILGGWISCIVIPLDWDREWQAWPIPVVIGSYIGAFFGYSTGSYFL